MNRPTNIAAVATATATVKNAPVARALAAGLLAAGLLFSAGCKGNKNDTTRAGGSPTAPGVSAKSDASFGVRLKAGPAPLNYNFGPGGDLRIVDVNTGERLVGMTAPPQAAISVDATRGITLNGRMIYPGPLPAGHRYELWTNKSAPR